MTAAQAALDCCEHRNFPVAEGTLGKENGFAEGCHSAYRKAVILTAVHSLRQKKTPGADPGAFIFVFVFRFGSGHSNEKS